MPNTSDPNIPLQAGQHIPDFGFMNPQQRINMQVLALKLQQAQQNQNAQNMLRSLYGNQENFDPTTNQLKPAALNMLTAAYPQEGMAVRTDMLKNQEEQARASYINSNVYKSYKSDLVNGVTVPALKSYDDALASGKPPTEAQQIAQRTYTENLDDWKSSSGAPPSFVQSLAPNFDPVRARNNSLVFKQQQAAEKAQLENEKTQVGIQKDIQDIQKSKSGEDTSSQKSFLDREKFKENFGHYPGEGPTTGEGNTTLTGDEYLKTLAPADAGVVKAIAEGRVPTPSSRSGSPQWKRLIGEVSQYDPSFDAVNYQSRYNTRKAFTSGKPAQTITNLNQLMGHLVNLKDLSTALHNGDLPTSNYILNTIGKALGKANVTNFESAKTAVADELETVFRGTTGSVSGIENWRNTLTASASPEQQAGAWKTLGGLIDSRIDSLADTYSRGMGKTVNGLTLLSPTAQKEYSSLTGKPSNEKTVGLMGQESTPAAPAQGTGNSAPIPPKEGAPANPNEIKLPAPVKMGNHPTVYPGVTYEMYQKLKPGDIYTVPGNSTPQMKQ